MSIKVNNKNPSDVIISGLDHNEVIYIEIALEEAARSNTSNIMKPVYIDLAKRLRKARHDGPKVFP